MSLPILQIRSLEHFREFVQIFCSIPQTFINIRTKRTHLYGLKAQKKRLRAKDYY